MAKNFVSKKAITNCVNMKYSILFLTPLKSHVLLFSIYALELIIFLIVCPPEIHARTSVSPYREILDLPEMLKSKFQKCFKRSSS